MASPMVSVVTPAYNAVATIRTCCESVARQDYSPIDHPTVVARRAIYERYGAFSVGLRVAGDYEFLLRIWDRVRIGFIDEVLVQMTIYEISTRPENLVRAYRESLAAAVIHGAHPAGTTIRCWYEILKHRVFFASVYRKT